MEQQQNNSPSNDPPLLDLKISIPSPLEILPAVPKPVQPVFLIPTCTRFFTSHKVAPFRHPQQLSDISNASLDAYNSISIISGPANKLSQPQNANSYLHKFTNSQNCLYRKFQELQSGKVRPLIKNTSEIYQGRSSKQYQKQQQLLPRNFTNTTSSVPFNFVRFQYSFSESSEDSDSQSSANPLRSISASRSIATRKQRTLKIDNELHINQQLENSDQKPYLIFDSDFESGNLAWAGYASTTNEYNLLLQNDINSRGFNQWFFFRVRNHSGATGSQLASNNGSTRTSYSLTARFNILNFRKKHSLYERGMKICVQSKKKAQGWLRAGENITYTRNHQSSETDSKSSCYYTLSFTYTFTHPDDEVYFSYHYPYTYSDLQTFMSQIQCSTFLKKHTLCTTISGNIVNYLTITDWQACNLNKKVVFLLARTHPGETISSYIMQHLIRILLSGQSSVLRQQYIFKIVPMMNPDGVIAGNSRCSLVGRDLNRSWTSKSRSKFPEIFYLRNLINNTLKTHKVFMLCDLHGHSTKKDVFMYGCHHKSNPFATREFPWVFSRLSKHFSYSSCAFSSTRDKKGTARVSMYKSLKIPNIFTLQTSFCGPSKSAYHWTCEDLKGLAKAFCQTLLVLTPRSSSPNQDASKNLRNTQQTSQNNKDQNLKSELLKQQLLDQLYRDERNYMENLKDEESSSSVEREYVETDRINVVKETRKLNNKKKETLPVTRNPSISSRKRGDTTESKKKPTKILPIKLDAIRISNTKSALASHKNIDGARSITEGVIQSRRLKDGDNVKVWRRVSRQAIIEYNNHYLQQYVCKTQQSIIQQDSTFVHKSRRSKNNPRYALKAKEKSLSVNTSVQKKVIIIKKGWMDGDTNMRNAKKMEEAQSSKQKLDDLWRRNLKGHLMGGREVSIFDRIVVQHIDRRLKNYLDIHRLNQQNLIARGRGSRVETVT